MHLYVGHLKMLDEYELLWISREELGLVLSLEPLYNTFGYLLCNEGFKYKWTVSPSPLLWLNR